MQRKILSMTLVALLFSTVLVSSIGSAQVFADKPYKNDSAKHLLHSLKEKYDTDSHKQQYKQRGIIPHNSLLIGGSTPWALDVNEKTNRIYISNYGGTYDIMDSSFSIMDGKTNRFIDVVDAGDFPALPSVNEKTNKIYVPNSGIGTVSILNGNSNVVIDRVVVGSGARIPPDCGDHSPNNDPCDVDGSEPIASAVNQKTNKIYVTLWFDNAVSVIDGNNNEEVAIIPVGTNPYHIELNQKTNKVYVANSGGGVTVIDGKTDSIKSTIPLATPFGIAVNEKTNRIYITSSETDELYVVDGNTDSVINVIPISGFPIGVAVNEKTNTVYVAKTFEDSIVVINGKTNEVLGTPIHTGAGPFDIGINEKTNRIYVLNLFDGTITVLGNKPLAVDGINPNPTVPIRVPLINIGILQLAIHDLYDVNRQTGMDSEDFRLNLSTVLDHGDANIANGGEFRNMENPITFTVASKFGQMYLDLINDGKTPTEARNIVTEAYLKAVKKAYETTFYEQFPKNEPRDAKDLTLTGDLALRTLHDLLPGQIMVNGIQKSILDPSLIGQTLSEQDLLQLSSPLDGQYDPEFRDMINPMNGEHIDLLERDSSFASQFGTRFTFEELQSALIDGKYDPYDQVMRIIRAEFGFSQ